MAGNAGLFILLNLYIFVIIQIMTKRICIFLIIILAIIFIIYSVLNKSEQEYIPQAKLIESVQESGIEIISFKNKEFCSDIANKLKLNLDDVLAIGFIADNAKLNKDELLQSGFVFRNEMPINPAQFVEKLKYVQNQKLVLYNNKSYKFHRLSCKYANLAKDYSIIPFKALSKDAKPCSYCLNQDKTNNKTPTQKPQNTQLTTPPLVYSSPYLKIILTDYTTNLKPTRDGKSLICKELISLINNAKDSIDIAIFGYDKIPAIELALKNAIARGVKIRLVYDINSRGENIYKDTIYFSKLISESRCDNAPADISNPTKYVNALMHDKFFIFDSKIVMTGSANLSYTDMSDFNSNSVVIIKSPSVAQIYKNEFNQMYNGKYHQLKDKVAGKNDIILGDSKVSVFFSPKDNTMHNALIPLIHNASKYIYIPTFLITDKSMLDALIMAKKRGVDVKVIIDAVNAKSQYSKHHIMRDNGILVKTENYAGKLHSKSMIVDDKYVVIGSMNFSYSGNSKNDENLIIIKNRNIAIFYRKFFEYLWQKIYNYWLTHDASAESIYSIGSCSDGIDNDYDGKTDMEDEGCKKTNQL